MEDAAGRLRETIRVCMFDQYGTLVDMQGGLTEAIRPYLREKGWLGDPARLVTWWRRAHFENSMIDALLGGQRTPYRAIGELSLDATLERAGVPHTEGEVRQLVTAIERLRPFPEVPAALDRLRRRYRLAILSNGDPDMLEVAGAHHGLAVDHVISAAVANAFKPHRATYLRAAGLVGVAPATILFVASHVFDCVGAKAAGLPTAFVNRRGRPFGRWPYQPDLVVPDMSALAEALA